MIADEAANETHLSDNSLEDDENEDGYLVFDDEDIECLMGLDNQIKKPKVNIQSLTSTLSDDEHADDEAPELPTWEEFNQQMEDYKNLSNMFEQHVVEGAKLEEENGKFKLELDGQFAPYDADKEKEIKTLKMQLEESALRKEHLKTMLSEKDW